MGGLLVNRFPHSTPWIGGSKFGSGSGVSVQSSDSLTLAHTHAPRKCYLWHRPQATRAKLALPYLLFSIRFTSNQRLHSK